MKRSVWIIFLLGVFTISMGCTSKRGLIELTTRPPGATAYLNQRKIGMTPIEFEYDLRQPAVLVIEKDSYYLEKESLDARWVVREHYKGNYREGRYTIQGKRKKAWKVSIMRKLDKKE